MYVLKLIARNTFRSPGRTLMSFFGTFVLVMVVSLIWSILALLDGVMQDKSQNFKAIVTERWQLPSQMPFSYASKLESGSARKPDDVKPTDSMTWQFVIGSTEPGAQIRSLETLYFAFALEPKKAPTMMDGLDELPDKDKADLEAGVREMERNIQGVVLGHDVLTRMKKKIGDRFKVYSINYRDLELELEVVGTLPRDSRIDGYSFLNREYLMRTLDDYAAKKGKPHPNAEKTLNLVWLRVPDKASFERVSAQVLDDPSLSSPTVKIETASSGISSFLETYKDLLWGMRWLLVPSILISLSLVIANAISISVRERRQEMAVLKVIGFKPSIILLMVLGEALTIGLLAGLIGGGLTFVVVNYVFGGIPFPIAFFQKFFIDPGAFWWGPTVGAATAFVGSIIPAFNACRVRVAEVFSRVG
jgi:putative ABC transport system permease protein